MSNPSGRSGPDRAPPQGQVLGATGVRSEVAQQLAEWQGMAERTARERQESPAGRAADGAPLGDQRAVTGTASVWGLGAQKGQTGWRKEPPESSVMRTARRAAVVNEGAGEEQAVREQLLQGMWGEESAACLNRDAELALQLMSQGAAAHGFSTSAALRAREGPMKLPPGAEVEAGGKGKEKLDSPVPTAGEQPTALEWERCLGAGTWRGAEVLAPVVLQPQTDLVMTAAAKAQAMASFAEGRPLVGPSEREKVEGVPDWIDNSAKVVKVMTAKGWWAPERVLLDGVSYYSMAGAQLTARLGLSDADLNSKEHRVQTATGKVETLRGGLTKEAGCRSSSTRVRWTKFACSRSWRLLNQRTMIS
jgi:hypothetical protein